MPVAVTTAIKWLTEATRSLSQETADQTTTTQGVWASLSSQFPEWTADERLRESVSPLISLIPSGSSTACPTLHALANALHQTGDNLSDLSDDWTERQLIEGMHRRLERITRSPRPPKLV